MRVSGLILLIPWLLLGCTTPAVVLHPSPVDGPPIQPVAPPPPPPARPMLIETSPREAQAAMAWAAARAVVQPRREYFQQGLLVYPWEEGRIWVVKTRTKRPTDLIFPAGEKLLPGVGIDDFWHVTEVDGLEPGTRARLVLIPKESGLKSTMTVLTTGGAYYLEVESADRPGVVAVTWEKPAPVEPMVIATSEPLAGGYQLEVPDPAPWWVPVRVYHNAYQTMIQCHPHMTVTEMPVPYALDRDGKRQLVNWTPRGDLLVIDRRGAAFELQGSAGPHDVVRIRYVGTDLPQTAERP